MLARSIVGQLLIVFSLILSGNAWAQYFVNSTGSITGTCTHVTSPQAGTQFTINAPGTVNLPAASNNLVVIAGSAPSAFMTINHAATGALQEPIVWYVYTPSDDTSPVSLELSVYPASNGTPIGTGFGGVVSCHNGVFSVILAPRTVSAEPGANYFITYSTLGVGSCTTTNISGTINGSIFLPPPTGNFQLYVQINDGPVVASTYTYNPASESGTPPFSYNIPPTALPYTITATAYPAWNGTPVGTGVRLTYTCSTGGDLTITTPQPVSAASAAIPVLSPWGAVVLSALLVFGLWAVRRGLARR